MFDADKADVIEARLSESKARLEAGIRTMRGNLAYFAGIDRANHAMHNVSIWRTLADANEMATFAPMLALAEEFIALGVRFRGRS
jgi:hypothetical protein